MLETVTQNGSRKANALFEIRPKYTGHKCANGSILYNSNPEDYCILEYAMYSLVDMHQHFRLTCCLIRVRYIPSNPQKTAIFRFTAVRTTNFTYSNKVLILSVPLHISRQI
jgi:hypothetical protein